MDGHGHFRGRGFGKPEAAEHLVADGPVEVGIAGGTPELGAADCTLEA
jgi:hypothetical protein